MSELSSLLKKYRIPIIWFPFPSRIIKINGKAFIANKDCVVIMGNGFIRTINNSWYSDIETDSL
jgi:hypothetical protein